MQRSEAVSLLSGLFFEPQKTNSSSIPAAQCVQSPIQQSSFFVSEKAKSKELRLEISGTGLRGIIRSDTPKQNHRRMPKAVEPYNRINVPFAQKRSNFQKTFVRKEAMDVSRKVRFLIHFCPLRPSPGRLIQADQRREISKYLSYNRTFLPPTPCSIHPYKERN
ncbi:hypothetical protein Ddc_09500 [Ditylenchus destructor]|nr:hypothetical protein Ddc_09500 [Ditylenchus destructor]